MTIIEDPQEFVPDGVDERIMRIMRIIAFPDDAAHAAQLRAKGDLEALRLRKQRLEIDAVLRESLTVDLPVGLEDKIREQTIGRPKPRRQPYMVAAALFAVSSVVGWFWTQQTVQSLPTAEYQSSVHLAAHQQGVLLDKGESGKPLNVAFASIDIELRDSPEISALFAANCTVDEHAAAVHAILSSASGPVDLIYMKRPPMNEGMEHLEGRDRLVKEVAGGTLMLVGADANILKNYSHLLDSHLSG